MSSSKKSKKRQTKSTFEPTQTTLSSNKLPLSSPALRVSISSDTHRINVLKEEKEAEYQQRRVRSPLSPLRTWIHKSSTKTTKSPKTKTSHYKTMKPKPIPRRPRSASHSNSFFDAPPPKYRKPQPTRPRTQTPKNTQSKYNKKRIRSPVDPRKQLKFTKRNDKITIEKRHKKTHNKAKATGAGTTPNGRSPRKKKKKQSFVTRASRKFSHRIGSPKSTSTKVQTPPKTRSKSSKGKRGSFFSITREKTRSKSKQSNKGKNKPKHKKNNKSFRDKIFNINSGARTYDSENNKSNFNANISTKKHEKRSSLNMHKMRMVRALREEIAEECDDDEEERYGALGDVAMLTDDSSSIEVVRLKHEDGGHHKRGSSGIPSFFQKKLQFELRQYLDEKARLFIAYCMRMYGLRCTEDVFEVISSFHVMPFDSGFICMAYAGDYTISYHYPLVQLPAASMPTVLDGIHDDRLMGTEHQSPHSMPLPNTVVHPYSRSYDTRNKATAALPNCYVEKARSAEYGGGGGFIGLSQSESMHTPIVGDGFCDVAPLASDHRMIMKRKQDVIKKYKKKVYKKRKKDAEFKRKKFSLTRAGSLDRKCNLNVNESAMMMNDRLFYNSAPEALSEDDREIDIDDSVETDGFPDINYEQLLQFKRGRPTLEERETSNSKSNTMTYDSATATTTTTSHNKSIAILNEDTPTCTATTSNKFSELDGYYGDGDEDGYRPASPQSYTNNEYYDTDTMTPRTPIIEESKSRFFCKEFSISFATEERQIQRVNGDEWNAITNGDNGVGIAEWTLLSTPKVFDFYNHNDIITNSVGSGLGIGGFIDRTRGVCGVSLAPIYYQYGGMDGNERYCNRLDAYNLYTGDYITCCDELPFNDLYDTASSIVRSGYQSTLVISGGQVYGREIFDDNMIQKKCFLYAPWVNSRYHHSISVDAYAAYDHNTMIDKHGILMNNTSNRSSRRKSIEAVPSTPKGKETPQSPQSPVPHTHARKRTSSQYRATLNFENIITRPTSRSISHINNNNFKRNSKRKTQTKAANNSKHRIGSDWLRGPMMLTPRASHGSVAWDEHIVFCCGGFGASGRRIGDVEMLRMDKFNCVDDLSHLRWRKCESMSANKSNLVLIHWKPKTCIVSVGSGSKVVESYDPYKDAWKDLPPLNTHQISNKSCRFYYDSHSQTNCLMFLKFRNGVIKSMEYLDERIKVKRWTQINDQYVDLFNAQFNQNNNENNNNNNNNNDNNKKHHIQLQNIKPFCFA